MFVRSSQMKTAKEGSHQGIQTCHLCGKVQCGQRLGRVNVLIVPVYSVYNNCNANLESLQRQMIHVSSVRDALESAVVCVTVSALHLMSIVKCIKCVKTK